MKKITLALLGIIVFSVLGWLTWHNTESVEEFMHPTTNFAFLSC